MHGMHRGVRTMLVMSFTRCPALLLLLLAAGVRVLRTRVQVGQRTAAHARFVQLLMTSRSEDQRAMQSSVHACATGATRATP
jgi:hypothetical protein